MSSIKIKAVSEDICYTFYAEAVICKLQSLGFCEWRHKGKHYYDLTKKI